MKTVKKIDFENLRIYFTDRTNRPMSALEIDKYKFLQELIDSARELIRLNGGNDIKFVCHDKQGLAFSNYQKRRRNKNNPLG